MQPAKKRIVKIPNPQRLKNIALYYLSRYAASEASLRRVLENRVRRAKMAHPEFASDHAKQAEIKTAIDDIIAAHVKTGAVNDAVIADMKVRGLRRQGRSIRFIKQKLGVGGLKNDTIINALTEHDGEDNTEEAELKAAMVFCKRKRLGQFRPKDRVKENDGQKDFANLARAGFSSNIIRKVLNTSAGDLPEALDW